ncbi:hypothetical protein COLO4_25259 [Corchorus olitorius]|uniref:RRM domain-containing protein n=1 Tax=Corchorus olitorius TaxID=93759 RepID=A0A1R3I3T8_9ROSI|nr:hypothetical protein COLO4_25259 [Corchorus olitorius]
MDTKARTGRRVDWRACFHSVFVGNLHKETTLGTLWKIFSEYGVVVDLFVPNKNQGSWNSFQSKFAFVRYRKLEEAEKAIIEGNKRCIDSRIITVRKAFNSRRLTVDSGKMINAKDTEDKRSLMEKKPDEQYMEDIICTSSGKSSKEVIVEVNIPSQISD